MHRSTSGLVLTEAGRELDRRARRIVADSEAAWQSVRRLDDTPRGLLRVSVTGDLLAEVMVSFLRDFPEVRLEVRSTSRHVDLVREGVDVAIRFGPVVDLDLIVRRVAASRRLVVGAPAYLERHGTPRTPEDLAEHACLLEFGGELGPRSTWPRVDGGEISVSGTLAANQMSLTRRAAMAGLGLALLPWVAVHREFAEGRLVPVLLDHVGADHPISVVYADREYIDPKVRVFVDRAVPLLTSTFQGVPPAPGPQA